MFSMYLLFRNTHMRINAVIYIRHLFPHAIACVMYYIILLCISALFLGESKRPFSTVRLYSMYRNFFAPLPPEERNALHTL